MLGFSEWVSHWYQYGYNIWKALILPPSEVRSDEILESEYRSLTGKERDLTGEGR
jgi:hypothetical protein